MNSEVNTKLFLAIIENYKGLIYKVARSYCADAESRKDLIQEIAYQIWRSLDKYNDRFSQSTWIYRIALNVAISYYRKETRRKEISNPLTEGILNFADDNHSPENESRIQELYRFIGGLKELDKAVMLLYLDEKTHREISEILGIGISNVATKISRIKLLLKQNLSKL
jgi:RNA polymerase sigma factor (sigma-70 family)